jgi:archaellum biogenesis ATPase FlaH
MNELKILAAVTKDRENYEKIVDHVDLKDFAPEAKLIFAEVGDYYAHDTEAPNVDIEILLARLARRVSKPSDADRLSGIVKDLPDVSGTNVVREVLDLKAAALGSELAAAVFAGKSSREIRPIVERWISVSDAEGLDNESEIYTAQPIHGLVARRLDQGSLIQIAPRALNDRLDGGALPGHHVLVFAPTEMGKTLFVINMVAHFLRQGHRTLYVGNEDPADDIILRLASRISGMDKYGIKASPETVQELLDANGWKDFIFADLAPGTFPRIERLVKKYDPKILVLDQLSNINVNVSKSESKTGSLEQAAKEARALAKRCGILVVSVTQAADSATGRVVLGRGDVHNSNIGIPGQVDLMLGIGADEAMESRGLREISLVKNKISGNHDHFTVRFNPILSKVEQ